MSDALVVRDVSKTYGETVALEGVSLSVAEGEIFACIGPNGAGKTTLVRAMTGTTEPDAGEVAVLGQPPVGVDRQRLGVLPQAFSPPARLTPRELLRYYGGLYERSLPVEELLETVGVSHRADTQYEDLSGGEQRRVCLAIALAPDPDVLFLDEPTTAIDPAGRRDVQERIAELARGGTTVFLTTHDMAEAERLADRVALVDEGRVVATGTPRNLVAAHGGENRLVVALADGSSAGAVPAIEYRTEAVEGELRVYGVDPTEIGDVADVLEDAGIEYESLSWAEPTLEDVYLALTGHGYDPAGRPDGDGSSPRDNPSDGDGPSDTDHPSDGGGPSDTDDSSDADEPSSADGPTSNDGPAETATSGGDGA